MIIFPYHKIVVNLHVYSMTVIKISVIKAVTMIFCYTNVVIAGKTFDICAFWVKEKRTLHEAFQKIQFVLGSPQIFLYTSHSHKERSPMFFSLCSGLHSPTKKR